MLRGKLGRGPSLDLEKCVENAGGNRYAMVVLAAARAREMARQHRHSGNRELRYNSMSSLLEIQNGKLDINYLRTAQF